MGKNKKKPDTFTKLIDETFELIGRWTAFAKRILCGYNPLKKEED